MPRFVVHGIGGNNEHYTHEERAPSAEDARWRFEIKNPPADIVAIEEHVSGEWKLVEGELPAEAAPRGNASGDKAGKHSPDPSSTERATQVSTPTTSLSSSGSADRAASEVPAIANALYVFGWLTIGAAVLIALALFATIQDVANGGFGFLVLLSAAGVGLSGILIIAIGKIVETLVQIRALLKLRS